MEWISKECQVDVFHPQSYVVVPKSANSRPFYILKCTSVVQANFLRQTKWQKFKNLGLFVGEDLTVLEQSNFV